MTESTKKFLVIYTGGTIGMKESPEGLVPDAASIRNFFSQPELEEEIEFSELLPLIDSSSVDFSHWNRWLKVLQEASGRFHGVLFLHGTDTMAYSAAMLSLLWPLFQLPVIMTGAMRPLGMADSDAENNLKEALIALKEERPGVFVAFGGLLLSPLSCVKISTLRPDAFFSPGRPPLATFREGRWHDESSSFPLYPLLPLPLVTSFHFREELKILNFYFVPGNAAYLRDILRGGHPAALILQSFGNGNLPLCEELATLLQGLKRLGRPIVNVSQVLESRVDRTYAPASRTAALGVIGAGGLTIEVVFPLVAIILNLALSGKGKRELLQRSLAALDKKSSV